MAKTNGTKKIVLRKLRTGHWTSQGQGAGAAGTGDNAGAGDDDDTDDDDLGDDDDDDDLGDDGKPKAKGKTKPAADDPEKQRLSQEAARRRRQAREATTKLSQVQAELDAIKNKDKPENDQLKGDNASLKTRAETAEAKANALALQSSIRLAAAHARVDSSQMKFLEFLFEGQKVDVEEIGDDLDDEVAAILKKLIAETPTLVPKRRKAAANSDDDSDDDDDDEDDGNLGKKMGRTAPAMNNGRKKPGRETEQQKAARLALKFPALGGRIR